MFQPYRGSATPYTADISATALHDGGVNPHYMGPSGRLSGGMKVQSGLGEDYADQLKTYVSSDQGQQTLQDLADKALKYWPVLKNRGTPYLTEEEFAATVPAPASKLPWLLLAGVAAFFLLRRK